MKILIVNDDGIYSPGILALAEVAKTFGEVTIVAPDVERSSMGHGVTHSRPLSYRRTPILGFDAFRVDGTPADCVFPIEETEEGTDRWATDHDFVSMTPLRLDMTDQETLQAHLARAASR
jgi:broad specificity polyphosphatase/5'/3'-nucleotidase SurE